ncbi:MAG: peptide ABC transporter permease [Elusimicrobia bacterium CG08_land_8_20_14_0_20_44_26]|nr:MAG: peptide ABC transporter permease [Elusimicrobia bacterium CG08_land_8_20_14_0_20_44_26]
MKSKNYLGLASAVLLLFFAASAIFAPRLARYSPYKQNLNEKLLPPSPAHLLGTDEYGRDVCSRLIYAGRISLSVAAVAVGISTVIGTVLGLAAGFFRGWVDSFIVKVIDIFLCIPTFFLILMVVAFWSPSVKNIMIVIGATGWPSLARLVRAEVMSVSARNYIQAVKVLGFSKLRIMFVHILPNVLAPIFVASVLGLGGAILVESGLSFLGLGVQPPLASWGNMLSSGRTYLGIAWWLSFWPGLAIFLTVLSFNLAGETLKERVTI